MQEGSQKPAEKSPTFKKLELLSECSSLSSENDINGDRKTSERSSFSSSYTAQTNNSHNQESEIVYTETSGSRVRKFTLKQLNKPDRGGRTLLFKYVEKGNMGAVVDITAAGGDLFAIDHAGYSLLHLASLNGHLSIVKFLVQRGANANLAAANGDTPLHDAVENENESVVLFLLQIGANPLAKNQSDESPLSIAPSGTMERLLKDWIEWTEKACVPDPKTAETLLHKAARTGNLELARKCLKYGASVDDRDSTGLTPLHCCCASGAVDCAALLLEYGAEPDATGPNGETPLYMAVSNTHIGAVRILLAYGADPQQTTGDGHSALELSLSTKMRELLKQPRSAFTPVKQPCFKPLHVSSTGLAASTSLFDSARASKAIEQSVLRISLSKRHSPDSDTENTSGSISQRPSVSTNDSDSHRVPRHEHYWGGIETLGGALSAREMRKMPGLMKRFESLSSLSANSKPLTKPETVGSRKRQHRSSSVSSQASVDFPATHSDMPDKDSRARPANTYPQTTAFRKKRNRTDSHSSDASKSSAIAKLIVKKEESEEKADKSLLKSSQADSTNPVKESAKISTKKPPVLIPLRRKSHLPRNPMIGISGYQKLGQRTPTSGSSSPSVAAVSPKAEAGDVLKQFAVAPASIAAQVEQERQVRCLPLYSIAVKDDADSHARSYFVDFQIGLALGLKSGRELLENYPHLKRRVASSCEKLALERCQLARTILQCCVAQGKKWIQKTADSSGYRLSMLDLHFIDCEQVLQLFSEKFFGGLTSASPADTAASLSRLLGTNAQRWALFDLDSFTRCKYPIYTKALPNVLVPADESSKQTVSTENISQRPSNTAKHSPSIANPIIPDQPLTKIASASDSKPQLVIPKKFAIRNWKSN